MSLIFKNRKIYAAVISYNSSAVLDKLYKRINKDIFNKIFFLMTNRPMDLLKKQKNTNGKLLKIKKILVMVET